eukprot:c9976_g1_i2.p1 GENE.c9976_g1_i2~~c9976_g1_i2.p1  ORF type:complete len:660 (+),score=168.90 c9976_g1_i2:49-1980(+)
MPGILSTLRLHSVPFTFCAIAAIVSYRRRQKHIKRLTRSESKRSFKDLGQLEKILPSKKPKDVGSGSIVDDLKLVLKYGIGKRELLNIISLTFALLGRTYLTLWIAESMGISMKNFCNKNWRKLVRGMEAFASWSLIAAIINSLLKYIQGLLALNIRQKLTLKAHAMYMERMNYYAANKVGTDKFEHADQLIADDIEKFSSEFADVYSNILKPAVDFVMFSAEMYRHMGASGPGGLYTWFGISAYISTMVMPPYGRLFAEEQVLEGRFRAAHADLIQNSEMVAFMRGERPEKNVLDRYFENIRTHILRVLEMKFPCDVIQGYVNKYLASVVGFSLIFMPIYRNTNGMGAMEPGEIARHFVAQRQVMEGLATSVLALFELQKKVGALKGLSARLYKLFNGLQRRQPILQAQLELYKTSNPPRFQLGNTLKFERVSVYRPDGCLLLHNLNFEVKPGDRVMITGDNGCGKSSLFRVLCGLWPLVCGTITRPNAKDIYFLSQVNFVPLGTLRDLVIYPYTVDQIRGEGRTDEDVLLCLKWAHLEDLQCDNLRPTLDDEMDWGTALSPGQKQRMAFARLLFHRPRYAILDECTNGISPEVEEDLYSRCHKLGMAIFSISHKVELKRLHDIELHINHDEAGTYSLISLK